MRAFQLLRVSSQTSIPHKTSKEYEGSNSRLKRQKYINPHKFLLQVRIDR